MPTVVGCPVDLSRNPVLVDAPPLMRLGMTRLTVRSVVGTIEVGVDYTTNLDEHAIELH